VKPFEPLTAEARPEDAGSQTRASALSSLFREHNRTLVRFINARLRNEQEADPAIDVSRVGITGFSAGGYMAAGAMLRYPDFFKVGVAASGNHDQRLFWNTWGERYEGYPVGDNYRQQANSTYAANLKGKLLLFPRSHHDIPGYGTRRTWDYFVTHLAGKTAPHEFLLKSNQDYELEQFAAMGVDLNVEKKEGAKK
jgi:dipeptidyl-peptidase 4